MNQWIHTKNTKKPKKKTKKRRRSFFEYIPNRDFKLILLYSPSFKTTWPPTWTTTNLSESTIPTPTLGLHPNPFGLLSYLTVSEAGVFAHFLPTTNIAKTIHTVMYSNVSFQVATMVQFLYLHPSLLTVFTDILDTHNSSSIHHP